MPEPQDARKAAKDQAKAHLANMLTLEICFLGLIAAVVLWAFVEALGYALVSSRTPFVIMVPLFVLIVIHARRLFKVRGQADFGHSLRRALAGGVPHLNKVVSLSLGMLALLALITVFGHYAGILAFAFFLMYRSAGEKLVLAAMVAVGTTLAIYVVFELIFDIDLYRGLVLRYFAGFRDF
jgi:hypothetical protein